ncbi:MAG: rhamnulokinase [Erysipelotrichaceae bacterium]|nr:rhamnulokinase [Erysipelotrichaceae bacterium]
MRTFLAIDIGASSGRHILGYLENRKLILEEIYRFENLQVHQNGHDCWDMANLWQGIVDGLKMCKRKGIIPETIGIDTWAVDYVLLDENDQVIGDVVAYRDSRTTGMKQKVNEIISAEELYQKTGIQYQPFNTIYQLMALKQEYPEQLEQAKSFLMIPEYFNYKLTGIKQNEYTNATSTNLVNAHTKTWDDDILKKLGIPREIFGELAMPGHLLGNFTEEIQKEVGFNAEVMLPATHDTGSAFLAIPAKDDNAVYISSGTWSLLGVENQEAITTMESMTQNFTNEGGAWYRYRYLKNIMGLWMIQSIRRELNGIDYIQNKQHRTESSKKWSFPELIEEARKHEDFPSVVDVNKDCFLAPESMIKAIQDECERTHQPVPHQIGELMQCVYTSLALCYKDAIHHLQMLTGKTFTSINIVGGGCQDMYLNERTSKAAGLNVYAGPIEGTAIGNLIVQMIQKEELKDLQDARDVIRASFNIKEIKS